MCGLGVLTPAESLMCMTGVINSPRYLPRPCMVRYVVPSDRAVAVLF